MKSRTRPSRPDHVLEQPISALLPDIAARRPAPPPVSVAALPAPALSGADAPDIALLGMARIDPSGRFHERTLLRSLGWHPGHRLDLDTTSSTIVIVTAVNGAHRVTEHGAIALPAAARHLYRIPPGRPVVLIAEIRRQRLVVHPAASVISLLTEHDSDVNR